MRKKLFTAIFALLSLLFLLFSTAVSEEEAELYRIDAPEEFTAGRLENLTFDFWMPYNDKVPATVTCSDPNAAWLSSATYIGIEDGLYHGLFTVTITKFGTYTLTFSLEGKRTVVSTVTVEQDVVSEAHAAQDLFYVPVGETVSTGIVLGEGTLYKPPFISVRYGNAIRISDDSTSFTALEPGYAEARICIGQGRVIGNFKVIVTDESAGVRLTAGNTKGTVGVGTSLTCTDRDSRAVYARMEITEGADYASLVFYDTGPEVSLVASATGWVTVTAYGTDGSSDSARILIYEMPASVQVSLPHDTLTAGDTMQVDVSYPEGSWYDTAFFVQDSHPSQRGISGTVAQIDKDGVFHALMPGTCILSISTGAGWRSFPITVSDSPDGLIVVYPEYGFDRTKPYQLSISDGRGNVYPAQYSKVTNTQAIQLTADGILTATEKAQCDVKARLENGAEYTFRVRSVDCPSWLEPQEELIAVPVDQTCKLCTIKSDISLNMNSDLIVCSSDETIVKVSGLTLQPQSEGATILTVWSRYCDVRCLVPVVVTEPTGRLFIDGYNEGAMLDAPYNAAVPLPTVTDYKGDPVSVKWVITYENVVKESGQKHTVALINNKQVKALWYDGYAEITAVSSSGNQITLGVYPYERPVECSFDTDPVEFRIGQWDQVEIHYLTVHGGSARATFADVTFSLTGDIGCVDMEAHTSYVKFTGIREGTVTLTAKLYNGYTVSKTIHVYVPEMCRDGHDPYWRETTAPTILNNGKREQFCSRCGLLMDSEVIPCTGHLTFAETDYYVTAEGAGQMTELLTSLDGDRKQSFAWSSSDPEVAAVLADVVVGLSPGTATITVSLGDCKPATCRVHVIEQRTVTLPAGLDHIAAETFNGINATRVIIPDGITRIESRAFADCPYLFEVVIPSSVTYIANDAFTGSDRVTIIYEGSD